MTTDGDAPGTHLSEAVGGADGGLTERSLCAVPATRVRRPRHHDGARQHVQEHDAYPARHAVRARRAEVPVDDHHRDDDRHDVHDEREQKVLGNRTPTHAPTHAPRELSDVINNRVNPRDVVVNCVHSRDVVANRVRSYRLRYILQAPFLYAWL